MSRISHTLLLSLLLAGSALTSQAEEHPTQHEMHHPQPVIQLTPPIQEALTEEMIGVQNTMMQMMPSIAAGDWDRVAELAQRIEGAFILRQRLTPEQMEELHRVLPPAFIELDTQFHQMAGMLAQVAQARHIELISFYYYKLTEGCVGCHGKFARHRFPKLQAQTGMPPQGDHGHEPQPIHNPEHPH